MERKLNGLTGNNKKFPGSAFIFTHTNPDGDALGSALAFNNYLKFKGYQSRIIVKGNIPDNLKFLPGLEDIEQYEPLEHYNKIIDSDLIVVLDLSDPKRLKELEEPVIKSKAKKIVIDHHLGADHFADVMLVDEDACSTGELVCQFFDGDESFKIDKETAECLYVAILTDTGSFRFPRTDPEVHRLIARLIEAGADPVRLYDEVYNQNSLESTKLLGEGFAKLESYFEGRLVVMTLSREEFERTGSKEEDIENFVERLMTIRGVKIGILITQVPARDELRISFRSKENYNVREIASKFNGGGHLNASGARIYDSTALKETKNILVDECGVILGCKSDNPLL